MKSETGVLESLGIPALDFKFSFHPFELPSESICKPPSSFRVQIEEMGLSSTGAGMRYTTHRLQRLVPEGENNFYHRNVSVINFLRSQRDAEHDVSDSKKLATNYGVGIEKGVMKY